MTPYELANKRYATKRYNADKKIPQEKIAELKEVLRLTPSSINIQPWKFTFVQNPKIKSQLAKASLFNEEKVKEADLLVIFSCADNLEAFQQVVDHKLPKTVSEIYNLSKNNMNDDELKNWFIRQVYIALGVGISTSVALGLDSTPMEGIESEKYQEILGMKNYKPIVALAIGYRNSEDSNQPALKPKNRLSMKEVVFSV